MFVKNTGVAMLTAGLGATLPASVSAAAAQGLESDQQSRRLRLYNIHTREKVSAVFWKDGQYQQEGLNRIFHLMRDFRANEVLYIDTGVLEYLHDVYALTGSQERIQILSGYRSPKTNEMLRRRSEGVAKNSLHILGKAIDFRVPGYSTRGLQKLAMSMQRGGIGYYRRSDFVHIDSGVYRHWE